MEVKDKIIIVSVFHPKMTETSFGKNAVNATTTDPQAYAAQARARGMEVDTPEQVADSVLEQIRSEEAEASM